MLEKPMLMEMLRRMLRIRRFEEAVIPMFEAIKKNLLENNSLSEARDLLLPKLLSGELVVSEDDAELNGLKEAAHV